MATVVEGGRYRFRTVPSGREVECDPIAQDHEPVSTVATAYVPYRVATQVNVVAPH